MSKSNAIDITSPSAAQITIINPVKKTIENASQMMHQSSKHQGRVFKPCAETVTDCSAISCKFLLRCPNHSGVPLADISDLTVTDIKTIMDNYMIFTPARGQRAVSATQF